MLGQMRNLGRAGCSAVAVWQGCHKEEVVKLQVRSERFRSRLPWLNALAPRGSDFSIRPVPDDLFERKPSTNNNRQRQQIFFVVADGRILAVMRVGLPWISSAFFSYKDTVHDIMVRLGDRVDEVRYIVSVFPANCSPADVTIYHPRASTSVANIWRGFVEKTKMAADDEIDQIDDAA